MVNSIRQGFLDLIGRTDIDFRDANVAAGFTEPLCDFLGAGIRKIGNDDARTLIREELRRCGADARACGRDDSDPTFEARFGAHGVALHFDAFRK